MSALIGVLLALAIGASAILTGLGRERSFYPTMVIVIASYYVLFAVLGGVAHSLFWESLAMAMFSALAIIGFRTTHWLVVAGLAAHGVFDFAHPHLITNPGVPPWWPAFCLAFDVGMACWLAAQLALCSAGATPGRRAI
jgi:hypothetical protein